MRKIVYSIADCRFAVVTEERIKVQQTEPFSNFVTAELEEFTFFAKKGLPPPQKAGVFYYRDQRNLIYQEGNRYQRYLGNFQADHNWTNAHSCLCFSKDETESCDVFFKDRQEALSEREIFNAIGLEYHLLLNGKAILHSSYITYENQGIVFTGPSGMGKSTQAELWKKVFPADVEIINGDRSVLGVEDGKINVYGIPFCGSSKISKNKSVPLKGIVVLRQGKENKIYRMDQKTAIKTLFSECSVNIWDCTGVERLLRILEGITRQVPVWCLSCLPDASAVHMLKEAIQ